MTSAKRPIATKALASLVLAGVCGLATAGQVAGTVVNLSGALMAQKADGKIKILALRSEVEQGDTLVSEKNAYAQIRFIDNSEITLKPNTTLKVEAFAFDAGNPEADSASFTLVTGAVRSITGLLGKRNKEKFQLNTPSAAIGIRGTTFVAQYVPSTSAPGAPKLPAAGGLTPGLYVQVIDGAISLSNMGGVQNFGAGQFGYTASVSNPPVLVPSNPAIMFTPPPAFRPGSSINPPAGATKPAPVDCEVR